MTFQIQEQCVLNVSCLGFVSSVFPITFLLILGNEMVHQVVSGQITLQAMSFFMQLARILPQSEQKGQQMSFLEAYKYA